MEKNEKRQMAHLISKVKVCFKNKFSVYTNKCGPQKDGPQRP
jgi:hypothetical protein